MARSLATSPWAPLVAVTSQRQVLLYDTTDARASRRVSVSRRSAERRAIQSRWAVASGGRRPAGRQRQGRCVGYYDRRAGVRGRQRAGCRVGRRHQRRPQADRARRTAAHVRCTRPRPANCNTNLPNTPIGCFPPSSAPTAYCWLPPIATAGCVWETDTGQEYLTLTGHTAAVTAVIVAWRFQCAGVGVGRRNRAAVGNGKRHRESRNGTRRPPLLSIDFTRDGATRHRRPRSDHSSLGSRRKAANGIGLDRRRGREHDVLR